MASRAKKNRHVGRELGEFVQAERARDPDFRVELDKLRLARRIRELREGRKVTQSELATRVKTTQSAIARLESGRVIPRLDLLQRIADALGFRLDIDFVLKHRGAAKSAA